jgi:hypothetical protein
MYRHNTRLYQKGGISHNKIHQLSIEEIKAYVVENTVKFDK